MAKPDILPAIGHEVARRCGVLFLGVQYTVNTDKKVMRFVDDRGMMNYAVPISRESLYGNRHSEDFVREITESLRRVISRHQQEEHEKINQQHALQMLQEQQRLQINEALGMGLLGEDLHKSFGIAQQKIQLIEEQIDEALYGSLREESLFKGAYVDAMKAIYNKQNPFIGRITEPAASAPKPKKPRTFNEEWSTRCGCARPYAKPPFPILRLTRPVRQKKAA